MSSEILWFDHGPTWDGREFVQYVLREIHKCSTAQHTSDAVLLELGAVGEDAEYSEFSFVLFEGQIRVMFRPDAIVLR